MGNQMLYTILLIAINLVGSLLLEMSMSSASILEFGILLFLLAFSAYIIRLQRDSREEAWNLLVAYWSLSIANITFLFFQTQEFRTYIVLMLLNLAGLLLAVSKINKTGSAPVQTPKTPIPQPQVVDLLGEQPKIVPYNDSPKLETYDTLGSVIEPDTLYTSSFQTRPENGVVQTHQQPELIVRLPSRSGKHITSKSLASKKPVQKKPAHKKPVQKKQLPKKTLKTRQQKKAGKSQLLTKRSQQPAKKQSPTRVIRAAPTTLRREKGESGRRRLILDL
ncbi:MAG: hypothetical protein AABX52_01150 [Nanoarchaeota archaeon]